MDDILLFQQDAITQENREYARVIMEEKDLPTRPV